MLEAELAPSDLKSSWYTQPYLWNRYFSLVAVLSYIICSSCPDRKNLSRQNIYIYISGHGRKKKIERMKNVGAASIIPPVNLQVSVQRRNISILLKKPWAHNSLDSLDLHYSSVSTCRILAPLTLFLLMLSFKFLLTAWYNSALRTQLTPRPSIWFTQKRFNRDS